MLRISLCFCLLLLLSWQAFAEPRHVEWSDLLPDELREAEITGKANRNDEAAWARPNKALNGQAIRIKGFVVPLEYAEEAKVSSFLLVPYFGACIHVPPPPENQIIHVTLVNPLLLKAMDQVTVYGVLQTLETKTLAAKSTYCMDEASIEREKTELWPVWRSAILSFLCAFSVCVGWILPIRIRSQVMIAACMAFAAGMLLTLGFSALIARFAISSMGLFGLGFAIVWLFERRHSHGAESQGLVLALHLLPECFFVLSTAMGNFKMGLLFSLAMLGHNLPLGLSLALAESEIGWARRLRLILLCGVLAPLLALLLYAELRAVFSLEGIMQLLPLAGGGFVAIASCTLLPKAKACLQTSWLLLAVLSGCAPLLLLLGIVSL